MESEQHDLFREVAELKKEIAWLKSKMVIYESIIQAIPQQFQQLTDLQKTQQQGFNTDAKDRPTLEQVENIQRELLQAKSLLAKQQEQDTRRLNLQLADIEKNLAGLKGATEFFKQIVSQRLTLNSAKLGAIIGFIQSVYSRNERSSLSEDLQQISSAPGSQVDYFSSAPSVKYDDSVEYDEMI